jgi:nucleotide-binding universal stress UspA family protein
MFKHILLPTDGSKLSENSVRRGMQLAKSLKASVTALHVIPNFKTFSYQAELLESSRGEYAAESVERAKRYLGFVKRVAAGAGVTCDVEHVVSDQPFKAIIKTAASRDCDLILMASHGRRGIEGFLLGSETQKVLTHSKTPVLVYR